MAFFLSRGFSEDFRLSETGLWPQIGLSKPRFFSRLHPNRDGFKKKRRLQLLLKIGYAAIDVGSSPVNANRPVCIENVKGSLRGKLVNEEVFDRLDDARRNLALWR